MYKKTQQQPYPNGVINFDHFRVHLFANSKDPLQFQVKIEGLDREFQFKAENEQTSASWQKSLVAQI